MTLQETRNSEKAVLAISGGFFSSDFKKPTGLVVIKNKVISPISQQLSGVIWIKDGQVNLTATKEFKSQNQPTFAIQGHPCLVDFPNKLGIHQKTTKFTHRVAIGQKGDNIFFIITDKNYSGVSLLELAKILQGPIENGGLACDIAINLDGGPAPGISVKAGKLSLEIEEGWQLPNCILLKDKKLKSSQ